MATKKEQRQQKQFVEKLLMLQGINYDDWLYEIHNDYVQENNSIILDALDNKLDKKQANKTDKEDLKHNQNQKNYFEKQEDKGGNN